MLKISFIYTISFISYKIVQGFSAQCAMKAKWPVADKWPKPANQCLNHLRMLPRDGTLKKYTTSIYKSIYRHFLLLRIDYGPREQMGNSLASGWLSTVVPTVDPPNPF